MNDDILANINRGVPSKNKVEFLLIKFEPDGSRLVYFLR